MLLHNGCNIYHYPGEQGQGGSTMYLYPIQLFQLALTIISHSSLEHLQKSIYSLVKFFLASSSLHLKQISSIASSHHQQFHLHVKQAIIIPILMKSSLVINNLQNYKPVFILPFISNILERVITNTLWNLYTRILFSNPTMFV